MVESAVFKLLIAPLILPMSLSCQLLKQNSQMFDINFTRGVVEIKSFELSFFQKLKYIIFIPNEVGFKRWLNLVVFSVYFTVVTTPLIMAFKLNSPVLDIISICMDVLFIIDLCVSLKTAYLDKSGKWIVNQKEIISMQLKEKGFWCDVLGSIPFSWFAEFAPTQFQAFFRLNRLLRVFKVYVYFRNKEQELNAGFGIKLVKFAMLLALYVLYASCVWYMLGCWDTLCQLEEDSSGNWTSTVDMPVAFYKMTAGEQFISSVYFVVGSIGTVGYGDTYPMNSIERLFCCMLMMSGNLIVGFTMALVTSDLGNAKLRFIQIHERVVSLLKYLKMGNIAKEMQLKSINFYNVYWKRNRGIDFQALLQELPHAYRTDILYMANADALRKISIFEGSSDTFYRAIASKMTPKFFLPGDIIFYQGDIGHEMYTIVHGEVEVCNADCTKIFDTMGPGKGFGEIALILETTRTASIRAKSYVDVYYLKDTDLTKTMQFFPELIPKLERVAEERLAKIRERDANVKLSKRNLSQDNSIVTPFFTPLGSYDQLDDGLNDNRRKSIHNSNFLMVEKS